MRLYVIDKDDGKKIHMQQISTSRGELVKILGSRKAKIGNHIYDVNDIIAEASENTATAMALGGVIGVLGGVPGVIIGGVIGALLGKSSDDDDQVKTGLFNRSSVDDS